MLEVFFDINAIYRAITVPPKQASREELQQYADAQQLWQVLKAGRLKGYISVLSLSTLYSLLETYYAENKWRQTGADWRTVRDRSRRDAYTAIIVCVNLLEVLDSLASDVPKVRELMSARLDCNDFEDNLQLLCAREERIKIIVTFNARDFKCAADYGIEVLTPRQLLLRTTNP